MRIRKEERGALMEGEVGLRVNFERMRGEILELGKIGWNEADRGIYRMAFTEADMEAKRWLLDRMEAAGLEGELDAVGNVCGRLAGRGRGHLVMGSHTDTVPCAGALDGSLGVLVGLECLRRVKESGHEPEKTLELISFADEEGRFGGMLGSQAICGLLTPEAIRTAEDLDGIRLVDVLKSHGMEPMRILEVERSAGLIDGYLELHIEQGPVLHSQGRSIGIVDEITGLFRWVVAIEGQANHAGTTPMEMRHDAFMGLADFAHELPRVLAENGTERSRATIGKAEILPGAANTVPGLVEFSLDVRDTSAEVLEGLRDAFRRVLSAITRRRNLGYHFEEMSRIEPVICDSGMVSVIEEESRGLGLDGLKMASGAAHDAQMMSHIAPVGMIFVPSRDGLSHTPAEWTAWKDIEAGANLALRTVWRLSA